MTSKHSLSLLALALVFAASTLADEAVSTQELTDLLASGRSREAVARVEALPAEQRPEDAVWNFLAEAVRDFAQLARAEAIGTGRFPDGQRIKAFGGDYYALLPIDVDLDEAKALAASFGGRLAEIRSEEEQRFIVETLLMPTASALGGVFGAWTGIENGAPGEKDSWHLSDGSPITFARWINGEPNGNNGESVAVMMYSDQAGQGGDASPDKGGGSLAKCPLIQWNSLPSRAGETPLALAETATAPVLAMTALPSFDALRDRAVRAIEEQCVAPGEASFAALVGAYRRALESAEKDATTRGELEEVVAIRSEARLAESWKTLADGAEISPQPPHPSVVAMRGKLVKGVAGLLKARSETMVPLISTYRDALGGIESELTVAYRIDDALAIRGLRNELALLIGAEAQAVASPMLTSAQTAPAGRPKDELQLDIPERAWPTRSYDPGKPGKLNGFGQVWPGDTALDLSRAEGISDFVKVALLDVGWVALRADGTVVSTRDKLNGITGIWRMIPKAEDGVLLFRDDDTITVNEGNTIRYDGVPIVAREVASASHCNGGGIATMKDGRVLLCGDGFTEAERSAIEKAFAGVTIHAPYRYGVWGAKPDGGVVVAVLGDVDRLKKEGGVRLPEIEERSSRAKIVEMKGSMGTPVMLTDEGELLESIGGWFPKRTGAEPFGAEMDASMKKNAVAAWQGNEVKVVLSKTGRWQVANFFEQDRGRFARELDSRLQSVPGPIKDLSVNARWEDDKDKGLAFALWIE
jgi:hypothetical protein